MTDIANPAEALRGLANIYVEDCTDQDGPKLGLGCGFCGDPITVPGGEARVLWPLTDDADDGGASVGDLLQAGLLHLAAGCDRGGE